MATLSGLRPRVLIAEDDGSLRRLLEIRLDNAGFDTRSACDGVEALEVAGEWTPDLVVCDVMMPRLSGLSVSRELRTRETTTEVPIILLTARCFDEDIQRVMTLGNIEYMGKPFDFSALDTSIRTMLGIATPPGPRVVRLADSPAG